MLTVVNRILVELRDDDGVDAIAHGRVRANQPAPEVRGPSGVIATADAQGPEAYNAFVVLSQLGGIRQPRMPARSARIAVRCYGRTFKEADDLYGACSDALHHIGPRLHSNGLGIYLSLDATGGDASKDPDTQQPVVTFIVDLLATTQAVAV